MTRVRVGATEGETQRGEAWADAARRLAGGEVVPVDLSGEVKRFGVDPDTRVAVREATRGDLRDLLAWLGDDAVRRWWPVPAPEATYAARINGEDPTRVWIAEVNGRSVGFVQDHPVTDDPDALGIDYAIGAGQWRGRGLGPRLLWAWLRRTHGRAARCVAAPDHRNAASRRVLLKTGFVEGLWYDEPQRDGSVQTLVGHTLDVAAVFSRAGADLTAPPPPEASGNTSAR